MKHYYKTIVLFCLGLCVCSAAPVYAQGKKEVAKNVIRKLTPQEASNKRIHAILWEKAKASRAERAIKKNMRMQSALQAANNYHPLTERNRIVPTPKEQLEFNAYRLTPDQIQTQAARYEELMQQFLAFKQNWDARVFYLELYKNFNAIEPMERKQLLRSGGELMSRVKYQLDFLLKDDKPLQQAYDYLASALEQLEPAYFGMFERKGAPTRQDRAFVPEQFFLKDPSQAKWRETQWADYQPLYSGAKELVAPIASQLPQNLHIALVNDHPGMIGSVKNWVAAGYFGKGAKVEIFQTASALLQTKKEFDVIITDILVPGGGGQFLAYHLRKTGYNKPILALSEYREEDCRAAELFNVGIDGYIYADDFFRNYIGYRYLPAALKTYFDLKSANHWQH